MSTQKELSGIYMANQCTDESDTIIALSQVRELLITNKNKAVYKRLISLEKKHEKFIRKN
jgi:hypothetical protein